MWGFLHMLYSKIYMLKKFRKTLFIHRRDLRVQDNTALNEALQNSDRVIPCFIFDPEQISPKNEYRSDRLINFMIECLEDLEEQYEKIGGKIYFFNGNPASVVEKLTKTEGIDAVCFNEDYTPYSLKRDAEIKLVCQKNSIPVFTSHDLLLIGNPNNVLTASSKPFTVFTPFWKKSVTIRVEKPSKVDAGDFATLKESLSETTSLQQFMIPNISDNSEIKGGRKEARNILKTISNLKTYDETHDGLFLKTSRLSAHNKFGTVSVREVFHSVGVALGYEHPLIRQMYWRDFYTYIVFHFPHVIGNSFDKKNEKIYFNESLEGLEEWKNGKTGIPIVDAGMRELNATGYMHNRARLITASFLTKDLHIYWWIGEKYFAQKLIDYDICLNNGNWQWVGGTGVDPVPYFRIFNPWLQAKKFDPNAEYIKKWVPELASLTAEEIHSLNENNIFHVSDYPRPIIDHHKEAQKVKDLYA